MNNTLTTPVCCDKTLKRLLYLLTAHIAFLMGRGAGVAGALSSATEGSVSTSFAVRQDTRVGWFNQTQYGQLFWELSLPYRLGRYIA